MKKREDINNRAADMWSYSVLLWELATREVPFADMSPMEIGMKVMFDTIFTFQLWIQVILIFSKKIQLISKAC